MTRFTHRVALLLLLLIVSDAKLPATMLQPQEADPAHKAAGSGSGDQPSQQPAVLLSDANELRAHIRFLSHDRLRGRAPGTPEDAIVSAYLSAEFEKIDLVPLGDGDGYEQHFSFAVGLGDRREKIETQNVVGQLPGSDPELKTQYIVVGAHHDHLGVSKDGKIFNGADDNASGVAGLLAIAKSCAGHDLPRRRGIIFVAFGAEERGLKGARHFLANPPVPVESIVAMVNLDMIGRPRLLDRTGLKTIKRLAGIKNAPAVGLLGCHSGLLGLARQACKTVGLPCFAPADFPLIRQPIERAAKGRNDAAVFEKKNIPAILFSTSEHDDYHKPNDTIDTIDPDVVHLIATAVLRTVLLLDAKDELLDWRK